MSDNPYMPSSSIDPANDVVARRPRVWPVFTLAVVGLLAAVLVQVFVVVGVIAWQVAQGESLQQVAAKLPELLTTPGYFILFAATGQMAMAAGTIGAALLSPQPLRARLGMSAARMPTYGYPLLMIASVVPLAIAIRLVYLIAEVIPPDPSIAMMYDRMTVGWAVPFVLFIALVPGIVEELMFRGYMQQRLIERWGPWPGVLIASTIFAVFHITPHAMALALIIGVWLGVMAWRTGSVWPGVCCHAFVNGIWNIWVIGIQLEAFPEMGDTPLAIVAIVAVLALAAFYLAVRMLIHIEPPQLPPPSIDQLPTEFTAVMPEGVAP